MYRKNGERYKAKKWEKSGRSIIWEGKSRNEITHKGKNFVTLDTKREASAPAVGRRQVHQIPRRSGKSTTHRTPRGGERGAADGQKMNISPQEETNRENRFAQRKKNPPGPKKRGAGPEVSPDGKGQNKMNSERTGSPCS